MPLRRRDFCAQAIGAGMMLGVAPTLGLGAVAHSSPRRAATYVNPVLRGDHPDAGAIRVGEDFFLTHSSLDYTPGLHIWQSRDLVNWNLAGAALGKYYGSVWAPYLCEHAGHYYIYFPCDSQLHVVHAAAPLGPWSEPVALQVEAIDPAHIAVDGRRYLHFNNGYMLELSDDGLAVKEPPRKVFQPWPIPSEWRIECECLEAPKLFQRGAYIYLTVAQGGTAGPATSHMVVSARSRSPAGPWEYSPFNPLVHTQSRNDRWLSMGHGRLVEAADRTWWMTLHSYEKGFRSLGRQTLLLPIEWTPDGWFRVPRGISVADPIPMPAAAAAHAPPANLSDDFMSPQLRLQWQFWREFDRSRFQTGDGRLVLAARGSSVDDSPVLTCITGDHSYMVEVDVEVESGCEAGLLLYYDQKHACGIRLGPKGVGARIASGYTYDAGVTAARARLRIANDHQEVDFLYSLPGGQWTRARESTEVSGLRQNVLGGFLSLRPALYACGSGKAIFRSFAHRAL